MVLSHSKTTPQAKVVCLMGPTASGKTQVAVALAQRFPLDIISVDSALVYRGMDIGTAKPDLATLEKAPHALINLCNPDQVYSVAQFIEDAMDAIERSVARQRVPCLVGGTMMYFNALQKGIASLPQADEPVRRRLASQAKALGWPMLHARLAQSDPQAAQRIQPNDSVRITRALEVFELTGVPISTLQQQTHAPLAPYEVLNLALLPSDRAVLHQRIALRFQAMLDAGLIDELRALQAQFALSPDLPAMRAVGYRQAWQYLAQEIDLETLCARGMAATRQLAKRQLTWLRQWPDLHVSDIDPELALAQFTERLTHFLNH